jgi:predicted transposase YdaD
MRRDSIFYKLFKQLPGLLFELIEQIPPDVDQYRFDSVEVKESAFRIDGVFLPPDDAALKQIFFCEVQLTHPHRHDRSLNKEHSLAEDKP